MGVRGRALVPVWVRAVVLSAAALFFTVQLARYVGRSLWGPRVWCASPIYDFGEAQVGGDVRHTFSIVNLGFRDLVIRGVTADCGCTATEVSGTVVPPGSEIDIQARTYLSGSRGAISRRVVVESNDPVERYTVLAIRGTVVGDLAIDPPDPSLTSEADDSTPPVAVEVRAVKQGVRFQIRRVTCPDPTVIVEPETIEEGKAYRLRIRHAGGEPVREGLTHILVVTNHPTESKLMIPVSLKRKPG